MSKQIMSSSSHGSVSKGQCPVCKADFSIFKGIGLKDRRRMRCPKCNSTLRWNQEKWVLKKISAQAARSGSLWGRFEQRLEKIGTSVKSVAATKSPIRFLSPLLGVAFSYLVTPAMKGPEFLIIFGIIGVVLFVISVLGEYTLWPAFTVVAIVGSRVYFGLEFGFQKFDLLAMEFFGFVAFWFLPQMPGGLNRDGSSGGCSTGGGGGGCGGGGGGCGGCGS